MREQSALVSGIGIAGPTLAFWLNKAGIKVTLIEQAAFLRSGGYVIDFWGLGYDIAEAMGLAGALDRSGYHVEEMRIVDDDGARVTGFGLDVFHELTGGRFVTIHRSELAKLLFATAASAEIIFGDEIAALDQDRDGVNVSFKHAVPRRFDIVIGADGLHSKVRKLTFGPQERFETSLGYAVAAFEAEGYRPRDEKVYVIHNRPGCMLGRFALRDDRTLFLFVFADPSNAAGQAEGPAAQKSLLWQRYAGTGWESAQILAALDEADDLYFDRVSQIRLAEWSRGRVALVGDAAFCPSLMAGQGSALAMTSAYVLAGELSRSGGRHEEAFRNYEMILRSFIERKQRAARNFSGAFAPKTAFGLFVRNLAIRATAIPGLARVTFGKDIIDKLVLPAYRWP